MKISEIKEAIALRLEAEINVISKESETKEPWSGQRNSLYGSKTGIITAQKIINQVFEAASKGKSIHVTGKEEIDAARYWKYGEAGKT